MSTIQLGKYDNSEFAYLIDSDEIHILDLDKEETKSVTNALSYDFVAHILSINGIPEKKIKNYKIVAYGTDGIVSQFHVEKSNFTFSVGHKIIKEFGYIAKGRYSRKGW